MTTLYETEYLSCAETAKLLRVRLKTSFPAIKFSVRSEVYAGGASINVSWTDGPTEAEFNAVAGIFAGRDFDGSIDLATSNYVWMLPDGSLSFAGTPGTEGSHGSIARSAYPRPLADAKRVHFGSNYVFGSRHLTTGFLEKIATKVAKKYGKPVPPVIGGYGGAYIADDWKPLEGDFYNTLPQLIMREAHKTSALKG